MTDDLVGRVAEDGGCAVVEKGDAKVLIEGNDGVCGNGEDGRNLRFGDAQIFVRVALATGKGHLGHWFSQDDFLPF